MDQGLISVNLSQAVKPVGLIRQKLMTGKFTD